MKLKYINQIRANISIYSNKKTTNILDGTYKSVYRGKSMNFENLRDYVLGDDVKDIDWKSSARSGKLLIKQFVAEKKHNILLVMDTGKKFLADTETHERKQDLALLSAGTIGYLAIKNNDYVGMAYQGKDRPEVKPFKYNLYNLEEYLNEYEKNIEIKSDLNSLLEYVLKNIRKRMIIFIITDLNGIDNLKSNLLKKLNQRHDVLTVNISDNYMFGENVFDVEKNEYLPDFLLQDEKLNEVEQKLRNELLYKNRNKLRHESVNLVTISNRAEIGYRIIELLEGHRHASTN